MAALSLFLFGAPRLEREERPLALRRTKALALLGYLAMTGRPQDRDSLIGLFWPEFDAAAARNNLRRELSLLKSTLDSDDLVIEGRLVAMHPQSTLQLDVAAFENNIAVARQHEHLSDRLCAECVEALTGAASLCTGDFMAGFNIPDCVSFEEWQFFHREELRLRLGDVLQALVRHYQAASEYDKALQYGRRWLSLDALHEPAHRTLMQLYALSNQHAAAVRQYEECCRVLDQELGVEPEHETTELYEQIRTRRLPGAVAVAVVPQEVAPPAPLALQLPSHSTPFIGRSSELIEIDNLLRNPICRLLTIAGPGGIGKTRLAVRVAQHLVQHRVDDDGLPHDVVFISLSAVTAPSGIVSAIARAVGFAFYSDVPPQRQLLDYLRDKRLVLLLDNFEHLMDGLDLLLDILDAAPTVKLVVTSRERLNVEEERVYTLSGLRIPKVTADEGIAPEHFDAVQLFVACASRVRPDFVLALELTSVIRICELVEGMPLAIELAASWSKMLPCSAIAQEIERNLDFLSSRLRNVSERHRSIRAVFEQSWNLLADAEREVLQSIAVFHGSFRQEAAEVVAKASLHVLATLVEKSLLHTAAGRYHVHELLRQFVAEKLLAAPTNQIVHERHGVYYLRFLTEQGSLLNGSSQRAALADIGDEIENVRAAWMWMSDQGNVTAIGSSLHAMYDFFQICSRYQEGEEALRYACEHLPPQLDAHDDNAMLDQLKSKVLARLGAFWAVLGEARPAQQRLRASLNDARTRGDRHEIAFVLSTMGELAMWQGRYTAAEQSLEESLRIAREIDDLSAQDKVLYRLAELAQYVGRHVDGKRLARESLAISRMFGRQDRTAYALVMQGICCFCSGEWVEAERSFRESVDMFESIGDQLGLALALGGLGWVGSVTEWSNVVEARAAGERSVALAREIGNRFHLAIRLSVFGEILRGIGDIEQAGNAYEEGLALARTVDAQLPLVMCLRGLGNVALHNGDPTRCRQYLIEALLSAVVPQVLPGTLATLVAYAAMLLQEGAVLEQGQARHERLERAFELLTVVQTHPLCWRTWHNQASALERTFASELSPETADTIRARASQWSLEDVVSSILRRDVTDPIGTPSTTGSNTSSETVS